MRRRSLIRSLLPLVCSGLAACATATATQPAAPAPQPVHATAAGSGYTPHRIYDTAAGEFIDFETLAARAAAVDVVYFGELHGHGAGHRMQHALLEAIGRRTDATLSMEMFERDVAPLVAGYAAGTVAHDAFLSGTRPWPRYFPDYHPLVEEAKARGWTVVAANVPRRLASLVAREGLAAVDALSVADRAHVAAELLCPDDAYRARFIQEMTRHPLPGAGEDPAADALREQRYYESQCVKDETMAEAIAGALAAGAHRPVIHVTGSFHSDHGDGIPVRVLRRNPGVTSLSVTVLRVGDLDAPDTEPHLPRADYLILTLQPEAPPQN
jgi:uncharacterized iron-regulated protein